MKITVIAHACLLVESGGDRLVIDPWLVGSCYWRSWWHLPPAREDLVDARATSAIYFTHEHSDHLHFPSLRRFPSGVRILIPRFPVDRMGATLRDRGYSRVEEVAHAGKARVGCLEIFSYQYGTDDSSVVVTDGVTTLLNLNDAKVSGLALRQILRRHPRIDFLLRSHAPAQAYPFCYSADDPRDLALLPLSYYVDSFAKTVRRVAPRWAIPFASNVCHLHPESYDQNAYLVAPEAVAEACHGRVGDARVVPMSPGDSWDASHEFTLDAAPLDRPRAIAALATAYAEKLGAAVAAERTLPAVSFEMFRDYMEAFARAVPFVFRRAYPARVAFAMPDARHFVVDVGRAMVEETHAVPPDAHAIVRANPHMLGDAIAKRSLNLTGISKRIRVHLRPGGVVKDAAFWGLLSTYELGYFPARQALTMRAASTIGVRWREMLGYARVFARPGESLARVIDAEDRG